MRKKIKNWNKKERIKISIKTKKINEKKIQKKNYLNQKKSIEMEKIKIKN